MIGTELLTKPLAALSLSLLTACALFPSSFDVNEHARLTTIVQLTHDSEICKDTVAVKNTVDEIAQNTAWLKLYGETLPNNSKMIAMESELHSMIKEIQSKTRASTAGMSVFYCEEKIKNINEVASKILAVSGRRPR